MNVIRQAIKARLSTLAVVFVLLLFVAAGVLPALPSTTGGARAQGSPILYLPVIHILATAPNLNAIDNSDGDNVYTVSWVNQESATSFILQESTESTFAAPTVVYTGTGTNWTVGAGGKTPGIYYYRVRGVNANGQSAWSNVRSIRINPLFVGLKALWDGTGQIQDGQTINVGTHESKNCSSFAAPDTLGCQTNYWYDPNPEGWNPTTYSSTYSITSGDFITSTLPPDPNYKWSNPWKLDYNASYSNGQTVTIDGQLFTVTGPLTEIIFGQPIQYWELTNQQTFQYYSSGNITQNVNAGDAVLRYDAGNSRLLLYNCVLRHEYVGGGAHGTILYVESLTAATSIPGSPPVP